MNVKYQIFVSSTYEDLKDERNEVIKACLNMGHIPVGMEMFNAADEEQWAVITRTIDQCDYYVVIVAHRYGSTTAEGMSFTENEYDYAVAQGVPVLSFVIDEEAAWPNDRIDKDQGAVEALRRFKSKIKQKVVRFWHDKAELQAHFAMSLPTTINLNPRRGWIRAPEATDTDVAQAISNLTEENARLRQRLEEMQAAPAIDDDANEIMNLLKLEVLKEDEQNVITGMDVFHSLAHYVEDGYDFSTLSSNLERDFSIERRVAAAFLKKLQLWDVIQPHARASNARQLTALGRKVYKRFDLAPPF